jgi:hypothetical protein
MEEIDVLINLAKELIDGEDKNLPRLKELINNFFRGKNQEDFDKFDQAKLQIIIKSKERILKDEPLTEIDRAFFDLYINETPKKYIALDVSSVLDEEELRKVVNEIHSQKIFGTEVEKEFLAFVCWAWATENWWDEIALETEEKDLYFELNFDQIHNDLEKPKMSVFLVGTKKYESLREKLFKIIV